MTVRFKKAGLPLMYSFHRMNGDGARVAMTCACGSPMTERPGHIGEESSACEVICPMCKRLVQLRVSVEMAADGGAPGTGR